uniref:non-specific serine/threonine protein kinase n=1 Tax=Leersia perrieri TaxID=77586 RepID=A0A0D9WYM2_9ORYZ
MAEHALLALPLSALTLVFTFLVISPTPAVSSSAAAASCIPSERDALVAFRASLLDPAGRLSSWRSNGHSCCRWRGVQCDGTTGHVVKLDLRNSRRSYSDYDWISFYEFRSDIDFPSREDNALALRSTGLKELYLTDGHWFGSIPDALGNMSALQVVSLYGNYIDGDATEFFERLPRCSWSRLSKLDLRSTNLSGELPVWIGKLSSLHFVDLSENKLVGKLPVGFGALTSMIYLNLGSNNFTGLLFEEHFASLMNLRYLYLSGNSFKMVLGEDWVPPFRLEIAHLRSCHLGPQFPSWLRWQTEIRLLDASGTHINDSLPVWFWTVFSHAYILNLSDNQFSGTLPKTLEYTSAKVMNLGSNNLTGQVPRFPLNITYFDLSNNSLSGPLPSDLRALKLEELRLCNNYIIATIPASLCQSRRLVYLYMSSNHLTGEFPRCSDNYTVLPPADSPDLFSSPYFGYGMSTIDLSDNSLTGQFPPFLENATTLRFLDLSHNNFYGRLPSWIAKKIPYLRFLRLRSNMFSGHIPGELTNSFGLHYLDLADNNISGIIPQSLAGMKAMRRTTPDGNRGDVYTGSISSFTKGQELHYTFSNYNLVVLLDLSCNSLTGQIPEEISLLLGLKSLNLYGNHLGGKIPNTFGDLKELESLDLSHNGLSGEIPSSFSELTSLSWLNLSYNNLSGKIPSGHQLQALNDQEYIYVGNPGLCGPPLRNSCSMRGRHDELEDSMSNGMVAFYLGMSTGFAMSLWLVFCSLLFRKDWRIAYFMLFDQLCDKIYVQVACKLRSRSSVTVFSEFGGGARDVEGLLKVQECRHLGDTAGGGGMEGNKVEEERKMRPEGDREKER